ncbi:RagB/SusD family nutrient uptake outer membrane protein [Flavobacterium gelatinilyticum]|uniref:RagB/SusD family nutrient uptake outer membrane protein n=1 Tax=Flavobacterium gelatinilyticum TaxID=3003260 RepID=UPI0024803C9B|nr:RagB/SusD family nutrient uptake outer membrane protein [Flavobacterium gelatinilyticum]
MDNKIKLMPMQFELINLFFSLILLTSCENFVESDVPPSQLPGVTVFEDVSTANAAVVNIYSRLQSNTLVTGSSSGISNLMASYADELQYNGSSAIEQAFAQNNVLPSNTTNLTIWNNSYNLIYAANAIIEGLEKSVNVKKTDKDPLIGEAIFLRSYIHFYLTQLYGGIPYVTQTDYTINSSLPRTDRTSLYTLLLADLENARKLLPETYTDSYRLRANKSVATALKARIALYSEQWELASQSAQEVIDNPLYKFVTTPSSVFLRNSSGTLWQLMPAIAGANTLEAQTFITASSPLRALSPQLIAAFEPNDTRLANWTATRSNSGGTWRYAYKYKINNNSGTSQEYSIQLRIEEMLLILAEAQARLGNLNQAVTILTPIRSRAGLLPVTVTDQNQVLKVILHERQVELFTENGHRFFDLKRFGTADAILNAIKSGWESSDELLPVPERELLLNPNLLPQNQGY